MRRQSVVVPCAESPQTQSLRIDNTKIDTTIPECGGGGRDSKLGMGTGGMLRIVGKLRPPELPGPLIRAKHLSLQLPTTLCDRGLGTEVLGKFHVGREGGPPTGALTAKRKPLYLCLIPAFCFFFPLYMLPFC